MDKTRFDLAQIEIGIALHRYQESGCSFSDVYSQAKKTAEWLPESRIKRYLENWLASAGEPEQTRYDKLAAYWAGLWAAEHRGE